MSSSHICNYIEYCLFTSKDSENSWNIDIGLEQFKNIYTKLKQNSLKPFKREYKEYIYNDLTYQNYMNEDVKIFKLQPIEIRENGQFLKTSYNKQKLTLIHVPSNMNVHSIYIVRHYHYRISNRVYVNLVIKKCTKTNTCMYTVYLNYNHDPNVDQKIVQDQIEKVLQLISLCE